MRLVSTEVPSGRSNYVLIRIEGGIGKGKEREAPSISIYPLPGDEISKPKRIGRRKSSAKREAPPGWLPVAGNAVTWTQTLGLRLTVVAVDRERGIATVEGKEVFGMKEIYDAPIRELCPFERTLEVVTDQELEQRLEHRLPKEKDKSQERQRRPQVELIEDTEDLVSRLIFAPQVLVYYRRRFASGTSMTQAGERLREELRSAKQIRKRHTGEYLRLRVPRRFDVVLESRPLQEDFKSCYVTKLRLPAKRGARKAA